MDTLNLSRWPSTLNRARMRSSANRPDALRFSDRGGPCPPTEPLHGAVRQLDPVQRLILGIMEDEVSRPLDSRGIEQAGEEDASRLPTQGRRRPPRHAQHRPATRSQPLRTGARSRGQATARGHTKDHLRDSPWAPPNLGGGAGADTAGDVHQHAVNIAALTPGIRFTRSDQAGQLCIGSSPRVGPDLGDGPAGLVLVSASTASASHREAGPLRDPARRALWV